MLQAGHYESNGAEHLINAFSDQTERMWFNLTCRCVYWLFLRSCLLRYIGLRKIQRFKYLVNWFHLSNSKYSVTKTIKECFLGFINIRKWIIPSGYSCYDIVHVTPLKQTCAREIQVSWKLTKGRKCRSEINQKTELTQKWTSNCYYYFIKTLLFLVMTKKELFQCFSFSSGTNKKSFRLIASRFTSNLLGCTKRLKINLFLNETSKAEDAQTHACLFSVYLEFWMHLRYNFTSIWICQMSAGRVGSCICIHWLTSYIVRIQTNDSNYIYTNI